MGGEPSLDASDARTRIADRESEFAAELAGRKKMIDFANGDRQLAMSRLDVVKAGGKFASKKRDQFSMGKMMMYVSAAFIVLIAIGFGAAYGVVWIAGDSVSGSA